MNKAAVLLAVTLSAALARYAAAQTPHAGSGTTLITLGTRGGPLPTKDRAQSSNLLIVKARFI